MHMQQVHMDCPRCGGKLTKAGSFEPACEFCLVNMPLYSKAKTMSAMHYDKGLAHAKAHNLTLAIVSLQSSVQIDKKNIPARNLLGLCYYAVGRFGEALREWVISVNYSSDNNLAKDYLAEFQNNIPLLERFSDALYNYNEALQFMKDYSEDLAAIRLKRAIEINPNFVDALNMLTLFYIKSGERGRAGILAERVLAIDAGNPFARRYYREIFQKKAPSAKKIKAQTGEAAHTSSAQPKSAQHKKSNHQNPFSAQSSRPAPKASPISGILLFAAGLGIMFLFMYILMLPSFLEDSINEAQTLSAELSARQDAHSVQISALDDTIATLEAELNESRRASTLQEEENLNLQSENRVNSAYSFLMQELPDAALNMLEGVDTTRLSVDVLSIYHTVRQVATPIVEENYHTLGDTQFAAGDFAQARESLERAAMLRTEESTVAHLVLYLLGRVAEEQELFADARMYYEMILEEFPGSNRVNAANTRLNQLPDDND